MEIDLTGLGHTKRMERNLQVLTEVAIATPRVAAAKISAAIIYKNRIISIGVNNIKTSPFQAKYSHNKDAIHLHAETAAIKNALRHISVEVLAKCTMVVCRVKSADATPDNFVWGLSKPCIGCQRAIAEFNIKTVYYTNDYNMLEML